MDTINTPATNIPHLSSVEVKTKERQNNFYNNSNRIFQDSSKIKTSDKKLDSKNLDNTDTITKIKVNIKLNSLPLYKINSTRYTYLTDDVIEKTSILSISDKTRDSDNSGGIFDYRLGCTDNNKICPTCKRDFIGCRGHLGHIDLGHKFIKHIAQDYCILALNCICVYCCDTFINKNIAKTKNIDSMSGEKRLKYCAEISKNYKKLHNHEGRSHYIFSDSFINHKLYYTVNVIENGKTVVKKYEMSVDQILNIFNLCPKESLEILGFNDKNHPSNFAFSLVPVLPPCVRPPIFISEKQYDNPLSTTYLNILSKLNLLNTRIDADNQKDKDKYLSEIYGYIGNIIYGQDKKISKSNSRGNGVFDELKTKFGLIRQNMMGKRVNCSSRAVAGPGAELNTGQVSIPYSFIEKMYYSDIVCETNLKTIRKRLREGIYTHYKLDNYGEKNLITINKDKFTLKLGMKLVRKIQLGDVGATGRQPSLSAASNLSYSFIYFKGKEQVKIHSSDNSCKNADFDGDELTSHYYQTSEAIIEGLTIHNFKNNLINPQSNSPLIALSFHGLLGWFLATKNWKNTDSDYITIPEKRFYEAIELIPDSIRKRTLFDRIDKVNRLTCKNIPIYSGNSLFSLCLPTNFTYNGSGLKIINGILVEGTVSNKNVGFKTNSLVQILCKMYSQEEACRFINEGQKLADWFTHWHNLSIGYKDFNANRKEVLKLLKNNVNKIQIEIFNLGEKPKDEINLFFWTQSLGNMLNNTKVMGRKIGSEYISPNNGLNILSKDFGSGVKGGEANTGQITGSLGVQYVGSSLIKYELTQKTRSSPFFVPNDVSVESFGYIINSYMDGISLSASIYHNMASRIGLINTAKSTADVGYTHRKIVKSLETVTVGWNGSVISTDDRVFSFCFNSYFAVDKLISIPSKRFGSLTFFANFKDEALLLNNIYEDKNGINSMNKQIKVKEERKRVPLRQMINNNMIIRLE